MRGNVTTDVRHPLPPCNKGYRPNGSGYSANRSSHYFNDSRSASRLPPSSIDRPLAVHRPMGGGVSLHSHDIRPLPPGPSGPQGLRGETMSKTSLPRRSEITNGTRAASTIPSFTLPSRNSSNSFSRRTGSQSDLRMPGISQKTTGTHNGRSPVTPVKATNSLLRSRRLTGSNSALNSSPLNDGHISSNIRNSTLKSSPSITGATSFSSRKEVDNLSSGFEFGVSLSSGHNSNNYDNRDDDHCSWRSNSSFSSNDMAKRGLVGLKNLGNTCFMNSVLQCLSHSRPLLEYCLEKSRYSKDINLTTSSMKGSLFNTYAELMQKLWANASTSNFVTPTAFKAQIQRFAPRFMGYSQQDAQEFLRYLLQGLHEDVNRVKRKEKPVIPNYDEEDKLPDEEKCVIYWERFRRQENSYLQDIFTGQLKSTLRCNECSYCSTTFDPFWDLSIPIPKRGGVGSQTLDDCIRLFTSAEVLDGDEKPTCARCKVRRRCTKSFSIQKFPKLLVLHLKRFSGERSRSKIQSRIDYPVTGLDLSDFCADSCNQTVRPIYNLYAVSCHSGSVHSGHYTAFCKHAYNGDWYDFDDTRVSAPLSSRSVINAEGYVLFYELRDS